MPAPGSPALAATAGRIRPVADVFAGKARGAVMVAHGGLAAVM